MTAICSWVDQLRDVGACEDAVAWAEAQPDFATAWATCERGDWLLWYVGRTVAADRDSAARKRLVWVACQCARLALPNVPAGETRPLRAIEVAEAWTRGEGTLKEVRAAAAAAAYAADADAAYAAAYAADADAAYAAAYAADADAADAAAYAAAAAYVAYAAYAADAAADAVRQQCADLVRAEWPTPPEVL
jgi:hypothetical protein